jgi:predicted nucleic acid-binding protein
MGETYSPKIWNDAYLAAYALAAGLSLVTFDRGFAGYEELDHTILQRGAG